MTLSRIDYVFDFTTTSSALSGTAAVLNERLQEPQQAVVIFVNYRSHLSPRPLTVTETNGIWELAVPSSQGDIVFIPQRRAVEIRSDQCKVAHFDVKDVMRLIELDKALRGDAVFFGIQRQFVRELTHKLLDLELQCYIEFELLNPYVIGQLTEEERFRRRRLTPRMLQDGRDPGGDPEEGTADWEIYPRFIDCMDRCEDDCSWWEIWCHAKCFFRCLFSCTATS